LSSASLEAILSAIPGYVCGEMRNSLQNATLCLGVRFSPGAEQASDRWLSSRRRIETEEAALAKPLGLDTHPTALLDQRFRKLALKVKHKPG